VTGPPGVIVPCGSSVAGSMRVIEVRDPHPAAHLHRRPRSQTDRGYGEDPARSRIDDADRVGGDATRRRRGAARKERDDDRHPRDQRQRGDRDPEPPMRRRGRWHASESGRRRRIVGAGGDVERRVLAQHRVVKAPHRPARLDAQFVDQPPARVTVDR
jgi:hypothetical protein